MSDQNTIKWEHTVRCFEQKTVQDWENERKRTSQSKDEPKNSRAMFLLLCMFIKTKIANEFYLVRSKRK